MAEVNLDDLKIRRNDARDSAVMIGPLKILNIIKCNLTALNTLK